MIQTVYRVLIVVNIIRSFFFLLCRFNIFFSMFYGDSWCEKSLLWLTSLWGKIQMPPKRLEFR